MTGICAAVGVQLLGRHGRTQPGFVDPEAYYDPEEFLAELGGRENVDVTGDDGADAPVDAFGVNDDRATDVIVIGGGIAGLTAARDLRPRDGRCSFSRRVTASAGARGTAPSPETEQKVEIGGTWFVERFQPHIAAEIARYGLPVAQSPPGAVVPLERGRAAADSGVAPVPLEEVVDFERGLFEIIAACPPHRVRQAARTRSRSPTSTSRSRSSSVASHLAPATHEYLSAWVGFFFGCHPAEVSALHVLSWVAGFDNSAWAWYAAITDKFGKGTRASSTRSPEDGGADIRLSSPVQRVEQDERRGQRSRRGRGEAFAAGAVVVAALLNTWRDIVFEPELSEPKRQACLGGPDGASTKVWALVENVPDHLVAVGWGGGLNWVSTEFVLPEGQPAGRLRHGPRAARRHELGRHPPCGRSASSRTPASSQPMRTTGTRTSSRAGTWMAYRPGPADALPLGVPGDGGHGSPSPAPTSRSAGRAGWTEPSRPAPGPRPRSSVSSPRRCRGRISSGAYRWRNP